MTAVPNSLITTQTTKTAQAVCVAAKSTYGDNVNAVALLTAGADGSLVKSLKATPRGTVTDTQLQVYGSKNAGTTLLMKPYGAKMPGYTMAATTQIPSTDLGPTPGGPLRLAPGEILYVAIGVALAAGIVFEAEYEDF